MTQIFGSLNRTHLAHVCLRALSFLVDALCAFIALFYLLGLPHFMRPFDQLAERSSLPLTVLLFVLLIAQILRFGSTLVFGASFGQLVVGLFNTGSRLVARLNGAARVLLETLLMPLLPLTHMGLLVGKATPMERWLGTRLIYLDGAWRRWAHIRLGSMVLVILLAFPAPLLMVPDYHYKLSRIHHAKPSPVTAGEAQDYVSQRFGFETRSHLDNQRFSMLPRFEFIQVSSKTLVVPWLELYDHKFKSQGSFKAVKKINLWELVNQLKTFDVWFNMGYPRLSKILRHPELTPDKEEWQELEDYVFSALGLKFSNYWLRLLDGPLILDEMLFRNKLDGLISLYEVEQIESVLLGDGSFIHFKYRGQQPRSAYLYLGEKEPMLFEFAWDTDQLTEDSLSAFVQSFFASALWQRGGLELALTGAENYTAFSALDYMTKVNLDTSLRQQLLEGMVADYLRLGKIAWKQPDPKFQAWLLQAVVNGLNVLEHQYRLERAEAAKIMLEKIKLQMHNIQIALEQNRLELFGSDESIAVDL